jgi:hypothetical protein
MLNVANRPFMLSVVRLNVVIPSVMARPHPINAALIYFCEYQPLFYIFPFPKLNGA